MVLKAIKARIYPNQTQRKQLLVNFGCVRFVWNQMLNMQIERHKNNKDAKYQNHFAMNNMLKAMKLEYPWLKQAESTSLQVANRDLDDAFKRFFNKKLKNGFPRFKRKKYAQSYTSKAVQNNIQVLDNHHIKLPKLGVVKYRTGREITGKIKAVTLRINSQGQYYLSVLTESENQAFKKTGKVIGLDLGLSDLIITSDGIKHDTIRFDKNMQAKLRLHERKLARRLHKAKVEIAFDKHEKVLFPRTKLTQFPRYQAERKTVAKLKNRVANQRLDYLHKITTKLVKDYDVIVVEKLNTNGMLKNHHLSRSIANAAWYKLVSLLDYKCKWYGKQLIIVDPKNTSRICSNCGKKNHDFDKLTQQEWLNTREWNCPNCQTHHDRDVNAAKNILARGLKTLA